MSTIEKKPGVYLCKGCGIADALSVDALEQMVASELKVATCRQIDACCSSEGLALIRADAADAFVPEVHSAYSAEVDLPSELFACRPVAGARLLRPAETAENKPPEEPPRRPD